MTRWTKCRTITAFIVMILMLAECFALPSGAHAQCKKPGDIVVDEDENYYYCKDRREYAACIGRAGAELRNARPQCALQVERCTRDEGYTLTQAGLTCVLGCLGSALSLPKCAAACGVGAVGATRVLEKCGVDRTNECFGNALQAHKRAVDECKR